MSCTNNYKSRYTHMWTLKYIFKTLMSVSNPESRRLTCSANVPCFCRFNTLSKHTHCIVLQNTKRNPSVWLTIEHAIGEILTLKNPFQVPSHYVWAFVTQIGPIFCAKSLTVCQKPTIGFLTKLAVPVNNYSGATITDKNRVIDCPIGRTYYCALCFT